MTFTTLSSLPAKEIFGGAVRGHYAHLERLTVGEVSLQPNTIIPLHQQTGLGQVRDGEAPFLQVFGEGVPLVGTVPQLEGLNRVPLQAALLHR